MSEIPFLPPAEEEFLEAFTRYEAARSGLREEFLAKPLVTRARRAEFTVRVVPGGLEVIPASTRRVRLIPRSILDRFCEQYDRSGSTRLVDYQGITFDASYLLTLVDVFARSGPRR